MVFGTRNQELNAENLKTGQPSPQSSALITRSRVMAVTRRYFLKSSGLALASTGLISVPKFLQRAVLAQSPAHGKNKPLVIAIFQRGAMDGLSAVVPFGDKNYYSLRSQIAIPQPKSGDAETAIDLDGYFGLNPALTAFKPIYDAGQLAMVQAVGSPDTTRSHFDAQDYMESATPGKKGTADGWLNRYLTARKDTQATPFRAVAFSANMPRTLMGKENAIALTNINDFGVRSNATGFEALYAQN